MTPLRLFRPALFAVVALLLVRVARAQKPGDSGTEIQGYKFETDVSKHALIDMDQWRMENTTDAADWSGATAVYSNGEFSDKTNTKRTLKGFSTSAPTKMESEGYYQLYRAYWGDKIYADKFVSSALAGSGDFKGKPNVFRAECANKGSQYQNVWMYVIHEMEDAINDCEKGTPTANDDPNVEAWDEAWAFYAGSLAASGNGDGGKLLYTLAQKRCSDFGTCLSGTTTQAKVNAAAVSKFNEGRTQLKARNCVGAVDIKNEIVKLMTIPLIQGTIRYAYQAANKDDDDRDKEHAEGWAFAAAVLPLVHNCDSGTAKMLVKNFAPNKKAMSDSPKNVVNKLSKVYKCLGFGCDDVGTLSAEKDYPKCSGGGSNFKVVPGTTNPASGNKGKDGFPGPNDADGKSKMSGGSNTGKIVGIIIGVLVAVGVVLGAFFFFRSRKPKVITPLPEDNNGFA